VTSSQHYRRFYIYRNVQRSTALVEIHINVRR